MNVLCKIFTLSLLIHIALPSQQSPQPPLPQNSSADYTTTLQMIKTSQFRTRFQAYLPRTPSLENHTKKWQQSISLTTFEQVLEAFPFIGKNMKATTMAQLYEQKACFHAEFDRPVTRFAIIDGKVYVYRDTVYKGSVDLKERIDLYQKYLNHIAERMEIPDVYFFVTMEDSMKERVGLRGGKYACQALPLFVFNKNSSAEYERNKFLIPDAYIIYKWQEQVQEVRETSKLYPWQQKIPKLFFRGAPTGPHFHDLGPNNEMSNPTFMKYYHRAGFVLLSFEFPQLINARFSGKNGLTDILQNRLAHRDTSAKMAGKKQHIQHRYLLSADGHATAWKRPVWIMFSNSILFKPFSSYVQWYYNKLVPGENFVLVREDLSDIFQLMDELNHNQDKAQQIIKNANAMTDKYLTRDSIQHFGGIQLTKFAKVQQLNLTTQQKQQIKNGQNLHEMLLEKRKQQLQLLDNQYLSRWKSALKLLSFQSSIERSLEGFENVNEGLDVRRLGKIVREGDCEGIEGFVIADSRVYWHGQNESDFTRKMKGFLQAVAQKYKIKDIYLIFTSSITQTTQLKQQCTNLPIFTTTKNIKSQNQQSRILIPDPDLLTSTKFPQPTIIPWQKKANTAYFQPPSKPHPELEELYQERPDLFDSKLQIYQYKYAITDPEHDSLTRSMEVMLSNCAMLRFFPEDMNWVDLQMVPNVHFVPLSDDLSDLVSQIRKLKANQTSALEMAKQSKALAKKCMTQQNVMRSTVQILNKYASLQKLNLTASQKKLLKSGTKVQEVLFPSWSFSIPEAPSLTTIFSLIVIKLIIFITCYRVKKGQWPIPQNFKKKKYYQNLEQI